MSVLRSNVVANLIGRGWSVAMGLVFIPLYVRYMGIEAYGLVGLFATLQALFSLLDLGMSAALNREFARQSATPDRHREARDLLRTIEIPYWCGAAAIAGLTLLFSGVIANTWVRPHALTPQTVTSAVSLMGLVIFFQMPLTLYAGGLLGLQRQVLYSVLNATWYTLRFAGGAAVLVFGSPTILAFLTWQAGAAAFCTAATAATLWRLLPSGERPTRFQPALLARIWRFAGGMSIISVSAVVLTQVDKVVLSRTLTLAAFGYYSLAWTVASGFSQLRDPVFNAVFPALSSAVAGREGGEEARLYHAASQSMALLVVPPMAVVAFFAGDIIRLWTGDAALAARTAWLLTALAAGSALNALAAVPFALQLAHGWTRLAIGSNVVGIALLVPSVWLLAVRYGAVGAALTWLALNAGYVLIQTRLMHRRLLPGHLRRWYLADVGRPIVVAGCAVAVIALALPDAVRQQHAILCLAAAYLAAAGATLAVLPVGRAWAQRRVSGAWTSWAGVG